MKKFYRQPFMHFLLIGAAFFGLFALVDDSAPAPDKPEIVVSEQDARWLSEQFKAVWNRPPTQDELSALIDDFVREEIYVREALALGLDQGDAIVRRRLRQKMEFLTEAGAEAATLEESVLRAYYTENAGEFSTAPRIAFTQIMLPDGDADTVDAILADLASGAPYENLGVRTLLPAQVSLSTQKVVDGTFGSGFYEGASALEAGVWSGPVISGYGAHIIRLDALEPGAALPFETVKDRIEVAWRADKAAELRAERFETLKGQYSIVRPDPNAVLSQ